MPRTRLFHRAGSPLIHGSSRLRNPWWQPVLGGAVIGFLTPPVAWFMWHAWSGQGWRNLARAAIQVWPPRLVPLLVAAFLGSAVAVTIARGWGAKRPWMAGTAVAVLACATVSFRVWIA